MNGHARISGFSGAALALALAACGDWPWPMTNPDDPLRCGAGCGGGEVCRDGACVYDPCSADLCSGHGECVAEAATKTYYCTCDKGFKGSDCSLCAGGYTGYPSCHADFCLGQTCSGHGTCSAEHCFCDAGYSGEDCSGCSYPYVGYPNCFLPDCTGRTECSGTSSLKYCSGTTWSTVSCPTECVARSWPSGFCAHDPMDDKDLCTCSVNSTDGAIDFQLFTSCTGTLTVAFYDQTTKVSYVQPLSLTSAKEVEVTIPCTPTHKVCFGAWEGSFYWGCGQNCAQACADCCTTCPPANTIVVSPSYGTSLSCN